MLLFEFSGKQNAKRGENKHTDRTQQLELSFKALPKFLDEYWILQSSNESSSSAEGDLQVTTKPLSEGKAFSQVNQAKRQSKEREEQHNHHIT